MKNISRSKKGFTLIELMVVIAIIGILAVMLFPSIKNGILKAQATSLGNKGKQVVMAIIQANLEREAMSYSTIWPKDGKSYSSSKKSTDYFKWLISQDYLSGMDYTFFAGGGVSVPEPGTEFSGINNAWNVVAELTDSEVETFPVLFTRNLLIETADVAAWRGDSEDKIPMDTQAQPFGERIGVVIYKGGAMQNFRKKYLMWSAVCATTNKYDYLEVWDTGASVANP